MINSWTRARLSATRRPSFSLLSRFETIIKGFIVISLPPSWYIKSSAATIRRWRGLEDPDTHYCALTHTHLHFTCIGEERATHVIMSTLFAQVTSMFVLSDILRATGIISGVVRRPCSILAFFGYFRKEMDFVDGENYKILAEKKEHNFLLICLLNVDAARNRRIAK